MFKLLIALVCLVTGCAVASPAEPDTCYRYTALEFSRGDVSCQPEAYETCGFGTHNQPVELDQSGEPLAYYCVCNSVGRYSCFGAPGLASAEPLPSR